MVLNHATICLPLGSLIDVSAEKARLAKAIAKNDQEIARVAGKLSNKKFVANANPDVVTGEREVSPNSRAKMPRPQGCICEAA
ncbi:MAG: hypothetical protein EOS04_27380 [Mesorhizobium sp.]|nr:MAG: hypothetical protein EOR98_30665 [Mesorhizobium sp.]RWN71198.1 MAG: hypothetical protein EOS01_31650 [Mesorhizobium sp.]RWN71611.1 MAG: hypothetical protein EOS02_29745 [Mesorhizobium sp.]RWN83970.1 MAG: hypothetical protein EOS04_27380 [Mesorhizobium sp.]RWO07820.1 MAG: hypothetical protein EOS15_30450 [Mesorhizobium sp.]